MHPEPMMPSSVTRIPPRVEAAQGFLHFALSLRNQQVGMQSGDAPTAVWEMSVDEQAAYNAALSVLRMYFHGEMDFGDSAMIRLYPTATTGTDPSVPIGA